MNDLKTQYALQEAILETSGKFFTVVFRKKSGELRTMTARLGVKKYLKGGENTVAAFAQYITVFEVGNHYRNINLETIEHFKCGDVEITA